METIATEKEKSFIPKYLTGALNDLGIGAFALDQNGQISGINRAGREILGLDGSDESAGTNLEHIHQNLAVNLTEARSKLSNGHTHAMVYGVEYDDNHGRPQCLDICCLRADDDGTSEQIICFLRDLRRSHRVSDDELHLRQELKILSDVAAALSSSTELVQLLKVILTGATAAQGLGFNRAFLFLHDERNNTLVGHMAVGPRSAEEAGDIWSNLDSMRLSLEELLDNNQRKAGQLSDGLNELVDDFRIRIEDDSAIGRICREGSWLNLTIDSSVDPVTASVARHLGADAMALVPMVSKGHLMGLLVADNQITRRPISDEAVELLQVLANQAAVAMERARLYETRNQKRIELEKTNRLLAETQDQIIRIEKMSVIGELTSAIAHELRNPLTVVGGFANMILKSGTAGDNQEYLNIIATEIRRAESVLNQVLDFSRASKGENRPIDFSQLVQRSLELLRGRMSGKETPVFASMTDEPLIVYGNYEQLLHAVYQFLKLTAEDLVPPGEAEIRTERREGRALLLIRILCTDETRDKVRKTLERIFSQNRTSQRLTILVAGETIRYHGGNIGLASGEDCPPSLYMELPLMKESDR